MKKLMFCSLMVVCAPCFGMRSAKDFSKNEAKQALGYMAEMKKEMGKSPQDSKKICGVLKNMGTVYRSEVLTSVDVDQVVAAGEEIDKNMGKLDIIFEGLLSCWDYFGTEDAQSDIDHTSQELENDVQKPFKIWANFMLLCRKFGVSWIKEQETILKPIAEK